MLIFDDLIFYMVSQLVLIDLFGLLCDRAESSWDEVDQVLFNLSEDRDRVWGLRFYLLITECFRQWGTHLRPTNTDGTDSIYRRMYMDISVKVLTCPLDLYYYANIQNLESKDAEYRKWRNSMNNKPSNVFLQKIDTFTEKENLSRLSNLQNKQTDIKNDLLSKKSTDRRLRSREELSNLVESLKHIDTHHPSGSKNLVSFLKIFEQIKLDRKMLMHELFKNKLVLQKITQARQKYQDSVIVNYDRVEEFLQSTDPAFREIQDSVLKELEFANWLFDYMDNNFNIKPESRYIQLRKEICSTLKRIYGVYPPYYEQFLDRPSQFFQTTPESDQIVPTMSESKYHNRDHSIQQKGSDDSSLRHETSLSRNMKKVYSFSKDANDNFNSDKQSLPSNDHYINEYGHSFSKQNLLSVNKDSKDGTVRTFLKNATEREKAVIRASGNYNKLNNDPKPYDDFLSNIKKVPVKITNTFKEYEETLDKHQEQGIRDSGIRDIIKMKMSRDNKDSRNDSKGSIRINFDKLKSRPSNYLVDESRETKVINYRDEYGRDSSHKKLTSNAKDLHLSLNRAPSIDLKAYSHEDTLLSLKTKKSRIIKSIFTNNGINIPKMEEVLIEKKLNTLEFENQSLQARKRKLVKEISEMSIKERSISEKPAEPLSRMKRTLRTITDFANSNCSTSSKPENRPLALNCLVDEFNRKNEMYASLKSRLNELNKKYEQKVLDSYYLNVKQGDRMKETIMSECMALTTDVGTRSFSTGLRDHNFSRIIDFDIN